MKPIVFRYGDALARLSFSSVNTGHISDMWSHTLGQGHARNVMQQIIDYADDNDITIQLVAQQYGPYRRGILNDNQLEIFYSKFGFERDSKRKRPIFMTRKPSSRELHTL